VPQTLLLSIDERGAVYADGQAVAEAELRQRIAEAKRARPDLRAVIAADGRVAHRSVVRVVDTLRLENVTEFALDVRPEDVAREK
jgi:biopolymer transport protein ExbD